MINYQPQPYNPFGDFTPVPEGYYRVIIESKEEPTTKEKAQYSGIKYIAIKMKIVEGEYKGRTITERIHINIPDTKLRAAAYTKLDGIAHALGITNFKNESLLFNRPFQIMVTVNKTFNNIKRYHPNSEVLTDPVKNPPINHQVKGAPEPLQSTPDTLDDCPF